MRIDDGLRHIVTGLGAGALFYRDHWALGALLLVLGTGISTLAWDIRRAGGLAEWAMELVTAAEDWDEFVDRRKARRDARRTRRLLEREKRRDIRRQNRRSK